LNYEANMFFEFSLPPFVPQSLLFYPRPTGVVRAGIETTRPKETNGLQK
jgi:hypothetical protein